VNASAIALDPGSSHLGTSQTVAVRDSEVFVDRTAAWQIRPSSAQDLWLSGRGRD
jgi:hypothetical protein